MRLFLFAIGGTGARVVRSFTMMLASGINGLDSSTEIIPIILDYDLSNGDKTRAINALKCYVDIHKSLYPDTAQGTNYNEHFFMTRITPLKLCGNENAASLKDFEFNFGPTGHAEKFTEHLNVSALNTNPSVKLTEDLLYALYDKSDEKSKNAELKLDMAKGFKGNPNIGSVVFHDLRYSREFEYFQNTFNAEQDKVFIISSIFGGTGASGFPEIVNAINASPLATMRNAIIGTALILPYFGLQPYNAQNGDTGAIDPASFNAKTRAALSFYATPGGINDKVNALYYIGDENHDTYEYNEGEGRQKNDAHVVEFVAASAIIDFLQQHNVTHNDHKAFEFSIRDAKLGRAIQLPDFTNNAHDSFLADLTIFAIAMKYYRDAVCGDRKKVKSDTSYYKRFALSSKSNKGIYDLLNQFLLTDNITSEKDKWGFYPWLRELQAHQHKLAPYALEPNKEMKQVLSHKTITATYSWENNPIKDEIIASKLNSKTEKNTDYDDKSFLKALRDVIKEIYNNVK